MKTQSSLEVPKQVRSASFDEIQLEAQRSHQQRSLSAAAAPSVDEASGVSSGVGSLLLQVPQTTPGQRSRSFDLAGSASDEGSAVAAAFLDVPKRFQRRKSSSKTPPPCIHCLYLEEYRRLIGVEQRLYYDSEEYQAYVDYTSSSCSEEDDDDDEEEDEHENAEGANYSHGTSGSTLEATGLGEIALMLPDEELPVGAGVILEPEPRPPTVSASAATECQPSEASGDTVDPVPSRTRRRSISRQEAIIVEPTGSSLENVSNASDSRPVPDILTGADDQDNQPPQPRPPQRGRAASMGPIIPTSSPPPLPPYTATVRLPRQQLESVGIPLESPPPSATISIAPSQPGDFVRDIYLQVPDLKRDRAASVDSCFTKVTGAKTEELQPPPDGACLNLLAVPSSGAVRSRSVDIVLPTEQQARYKALALAGPSGSANSAGPSGAGVATGGHLAPSVRGND
uniref:Eye-specific diacylglycerol kinase n=1 Tax=Anopheles stephensi TaxID=30069 RepID=A0A182Y7T7_ANOST